MQGSGWLRFSTIHPRLARRSQTFPSIMARRDFSNGGLRFRKSRCGGSWLSADRAVWIGSNFSISCASIGVTPATLVHPRAFVARTARVAEGSQVLANASVCADAHVGSACIVNTNASVDHESKLADGVHVAPGARIAGCVEVGRCAFVGVGAVILPRLRIGAGAIVGAGAVVTRDVPERAVVYGNPARIVRQTEV